MPYIRVKPVAASEGAGTLSFVVQLDAASVNEVRVAYGTDVGSATYGGNQDFYLRQGTLVFALGETTRVVQVLLADGTVAEGTESFSLDLNSAVNATVSQRYTVATILDNDGAGSVYSFGRGDDQYTLTSALDRIAEGPGGGIDTVHAPFSYTLPEHVENLVLQGAAQNGIGNDGANIFRGTAASNTFDGKGGVDTVVFSGPASAYTISGNTAQRGVAGGADGSDTLLSIERLQFTDTILAADTLPGGDVWGAYAMFNAAFNRAPGMQELSQWTALLDRQGGNLKDLAQGMINFYAPGVSDEALVSHLWGTIVGGPIPLDALSTYTGLVANGTYTQAGLLELVTTLDLNTVELAGMAGQTLTLDPAYFAPPV